MVKSIIKEIFIIILLIIAIVLILGLVLYSYNPTNKKVPQEVEAYVLENDVEEELSETIVADKTQNIIRTYRVDSKDLKYYEASNTYDKGKSNPFAKYEKNGNTAGENTSSGSSGSSSSNNQSSGGNNSQGSMFNYTK